MFYASRQVTEPSRERGPSLEVGDVVLLPILCNAERKAVAASFMGAGQIVRVGARPHSLRGVSDAVRARCMRGAGTGVVP